MRRPSPEAKSRAQGLAQETRSALAAETETSRKGLELELSARLAEAEATIAEKKAGAMTHVREIAVDAATAIVEQITGKAPSPQVVAAALDSSKA